MNRTLVLAVLSVCIVMVGSSAVSAAQQTIVAIIDSNGNPVWNPMTTNVSVGDEVEWQIGNGLHGVRVTNWAQVKNNVDIVTITGQQPFNATTGKNDNPTDTAGKVLLHLKINSVPPSGQLTFNCIVHGNAMTGTVSVSSTERALIAIHGPGATGGSCDVICVAPCAPCCQPVSCRRHGLLRGRCR